MSIITTQSQRELTNLHMAAMKGDAQRVAAIINNDPNELFAQDKMGRTALHLAAAYGHQETAALLLKAGANIEERDDEGKTPLHYAAMEVFEGQYKIAELLIHCYADLDVVAKDGSTPIQVAIKYLAYSLDADRQNTVAKLLIEFGANIEIANKKGETPLSIAIENKQNYIVAMIKNVQKQSQKNTKKQNIFAVSSNDRNYWATLHEAAVCF